MAIAKYQVQKETRCEKRINCFIKFLHFTSFNFTRHQISPLTSSRSSCSWRDATRLDQHRSVASDNLRVVEDGNSDNRCKIEKGQNRTKELILS